MANPNDLFKQGVNSGALVKNSNFPITTQPTQKNSIAPTVIGNNAAETVANLFATSLQNQDYNKYGKITAYDAGPNGDNRDRYLGYGRSTFEKIGFIPGTNNETRYNDGTTTWDDTWRMLKNAVPLYWEGIKAPIMSYLDAGGGDFGQDIRAAANYQKASSIGYSTKSGVMPFVANTAMSFAYTAGIMTEAALEAYALKKISPQLFTQAGKLMQGVQEAPSFLKTTTDWLKDIKNVDAARSFYSQAVNKTVNFINPVNHTWKNFSSTILRNPENLSNLARAQRTFGAFYLDARMLNAALSEGRLEGGFIENDMMTQFYKDHYYKTGKVPTEQEMLEYKRTAEHAGLMDTMWNTALVFYSNKIAFPNLMRFGAFSVADDIVIDGGRLVRDKGKLLFTRDSFGNALRSLYKPKELGRGALNYFKGNLVEGLQENMQEAIAEATKNYYTESFYHPNRANFDFAIHTFKEGIQDQLNAQGLETFGSGFLMGFGNKFLNYGIGKFSDFKDAYDNKMTYGDYIKKVETDGQAVADRVNNALNTVSKFYGDRYFDYGNQSLAAKAIDSKDSNVKDQKDAEDSSLLSGVITALNTGTFDMFIDKLNDIKQMTPEEIEDVNVLNVQPGEGQKALERIDKIIEKAKKIEKRFNYETSKRPNPINVNDYAPGTKEREDAELYYKAWEIAKFNIIFLNGTFDENLSRLNNLGKSFDFLTNQSSPSNPIYQTDVTALYDRSSLAMEIDTLTNEINSLTGVEDPKLQAEKTAKEKKLARLQKYKEKQDKYIFFKQEVERIRKFGQETESPTEEQQKIIDSADQELNEVLAQNEKEYKEALVDYLKDITGSETEYLKALRTLEDNEKTSVDDLFDKLIDIEKLDSENKTMLQYINMLGDPAAYREHVDRNYKWMKTMYLNKRDMINQNVQQAIKSKEYQALLNILSDRGIFIDLDEFAKWTKNKEYQPESFIDTTNEMVIPRGSERYDEYYKDFIAVALAQSSRVTEDEKESLRQKINDLAKERDKKIEAATIKYNNALKDATGYDEAELRAKINEYEQQYGSKIKEIEDQISTLTNLKNLIKDVDTVAKVDTVLTTWKNILKSGIIDENEYNALIENLNNLSDEELEPILKSINSVIKSIPNIDPQQANLFGVLRYYYKDLIDSKVKTLNEQKPTEENPYTNPEDTAAYKEYQTTLDAIQKDFKARESELREAAEEFKDFDANNKKVQINALSEWSDIVNEQPELAELLETEFNKYLEKIGNYEEYDIPAIRQEWLKTQGRFISDYMNRQGVTTSKLNELRADVPILKSSDQRIDIDGELLSLDQMTLRQLRNLRNRFELGLQRGEDKNGNKYTAAQKNNIKADIDAIQGYIEFRRSSKPIDLYREQAEIIKEKLFDRQNEITKVPGQGYVIDEGTENEKVPQRATELTNDIEKEITPNKPDFLAKSLYDTDALVAINAFVRPESDVKPTTEARVNTFIETVKQLQKRGKFFEFKTDKKLQSVREGLTDLLNAQQADEEITVGDVLNVLADIAYMDASTVGTVSDAMIRQYLEFEEVTLPEGMTKDSSVYKAFFGPRGFITELRDSAIDGEFTFIANYIKVFDKELGPLDENGKPRGLAGEMDILMVNNKTGEYMILDIKTGKESNWKFFNVDENKVALSEEIKKLKEKREATEDTKEQKTLDKLIDQKENEYSKIEGKFSKKLNYSIQQTIYRNLFYRMTGIMPSIALLPIEVNYDLDGNLKSAKIASQAIPADPKGYKKSVLYLTPIDLVEKYVPTGDVKPTITPSQPTVKSELTETDLVSPLISDNLSKPFMYKGKQGKLIFTEDGKYAIETDTEIIEINKQGNSEISPDLSIFDLGLTPISIVNNLGELITVDNKVYRVENLNLDTDTVTINGINYEIQRTPKKKQINGVAFMSNQAAIIAIDEKIIALSEELVKRRQARPEDESVNDYVRTNATKSFELDQLTKDRARLIANNKKRVVTGSNVNDIVFVINKALAFQNFKSDDTETRLTDLDELKKLFGSDKTFNDLISIFEGAPASLSKLFEEGFDAVTPEEITRINDWASATFMLLERQALVNEDSELQNALSFLSNLINNIKLVELNKDGKVSPKTETSEAQPGAPQSIVPKSGSEQPENVPGRETGQTGTTQEIEAQKADAQTVKNRMQEIEKTPVTINITQDAEGKMEQTSEEVISSIKSELDKIGLPYSDVVANDKGSTYFVVTKDGQQHEILKLLKTGNALVKPLLTKAKWINHLIKTQPEDLYSFVNAELAALEKSTLDQESIQQINQQVLGIKPVSTERDENLVGYGKVKDAFTKANQDTIDEVYYGFIKDAIAGKLSVSAEAVENLYKERKQALTTEEIVDDKDIIKGDVLISQIPIFTDQAGEYFVVTKVDEKSGKVTTKNLDNKRQKTFSATEIQENFTRGSMESRPIAKEEIIIEEETKKLAEETAADINTFISNPEAVKEVTDKFNSLDNEEDEDDLLADAAKNCNI